MLGIWRKTKQEPGWLAIGVSANGVTLAHVRINSGAKPVVTQCAFRPLAPVNAEGMERLRKELHLGNYACTTLLNAGEYQILLVDAMNVPPDELKAAIRWRIKDLLTYHVDDATVDVLQIPGDKGVGVRPQGMYAIAAPNDTIQQRISLFEAAKIPLSVIDIQETAQRNIAALCEEPGRGLAMLSFNSDGGLLTITKEGELYLTRRIDVGLGDVQDADENLRRENFDRVTLELQRSLDHFDRQYHFVTLSKVLLGPIPDPEPLRAHLATNLYLPVETLDLSRVLDLSAVPDLTDGETQAACLKVLGAALRHEEKAL
ncbi:MAG: agglutinin biogenesis protein MshI [Betaproteobacteria bacterium]|nr:agglutinin biogenesis protein MshI [Betaproteobacteria bacterium]